MKFNKILQEEKIPVVGSTPVGKRLKSKLKINMFAFNEKGEPLDVMHGNPKDFEAFGRGGWVNNQLYVTGGWNGDPAGGHKNNTKYGFYWGINYNAKDFNGENVFFLRPRSADSDSKIISKYSKEIIKAILRLL